MITGEPGAPADLDLSLLGTSSSESFAMSSTQNDQDFVSAESKYQFLKGFVVFCVLTYIDIHHIMVRIGCV